MVGFLESDNWNSGVEETAEKGDVVMLVVLEGVGVTTSSRHCGIGFRPAIAGGLTDWKAWIGRASKNSCANMNGVFVGSGDSDCTYLDRELGRKMVGLPLGTKRMSSHHTMGRFEYLLLLRNPISILSRGESPHKSFRWLSRSV